MLVHQGARSAALWTGADEDRLAQHMQEELDEIMTNDVFEEFQWRGLIQEYSAGLPEALAKDKVTAYIGFDPTSDSLQVGNLMTLMGLARLQRFGHTPIAVAGGGTGLIGDPSGKSARAPVAEPGADRSQHREHQGAVGAVPRLRGARQPGATRSTTPTG